MVSFFTPQQQFLAGFKDPNVIVVLTLSHCITNLISAPSETRIMIIMVSFPKSVCWRGSKVVKYEQEKMLSTVYNSQQFCHKQSQSCEAVPSPARLGETFQVSYQKIFTSVKYCSSILSVDIGETGPRRNRTFQRFMEDHSQQNMIRSQNGCNI